jgi:hypothetical protein
MPKPILVKTDVAIIFIIRCRNEVKNDDTIRAARKSIYNRAARGYITRYGESGRGQQLWDLNELVRPYAKRVTIVS